MFVGGMLVGAIFANGGLEMGLANRVQANRVQANGPQANGAQATGAWQRGVLQMERLQIGRLRKSKENGGWRKVNTFQGLTKPFESVILILSYG